jgi:hypothetical protein
VANHSKEYVESIPPKPFAKSSISSPRQRVSGAVKEASKGGRMVMFMEVVSGGLQSSLVMSFKFLVLSCELFTVDGLKFRGFSVLIKLSFKSPS